MFPTINECTNVFIGILNLEASCQSNELEIYEPFQSLTLDLISRCALALQLNCQKNPQVSFTWLYWLNNLDFFMTVVFYNRMKFYYPSESFFALTSVGLWSCLSAFQDFVLVLGFFFVLHLLINSSLLSSTTFDL